MESIIEKSDWAVWQDGNSKSMSMPHFKLSALLSSSTNNKGDYMNKIPYASLVGSLMYAMVCTRPDIAQEVIMVSRYMHDPRKVHWQATR